MKREYDFSKGERGKFYKPDAAFKLPVYLDEEVQAYLAKKAEAKGLELSELVNKLRSTQALYLFSLSLFAPRKSWR